MTDPPFNSWQSVQEEVLARIHSRQWKPGDLIPNEADLAQEFGCARATVNRALQNLADEGLLDRRRKAGTARIDGGAALCAATNASRSESSSGALAPC